MAMAIDVRGLSKVFTSLLGRGRSHEVFRDVSFTIEPREIMGLMGPNGAGKTTLLKILATLITPTSGAFSVCGHDGLHQDTKVRTCVGLLLPEERSWDPRLTGRQNLAFFAACSLVPGRLAQSRMGQLATAFNLGELDTAVARYSAGMRQKLALIRALLHDPPVLLLDEPLRSLDPDASRRCRDWMAQMVTEQRKTVLWVTHRADELPSLPTPPRIGRLEAGAWRWG